MAESKKLTPAEKELRNIKEHIRRQLKKTGVDTSTLGQSIELLASDLLAYRKARAVFFDPNTDLFPVEMSRELQPRVTAHPVFGVMRNLSERVNKDLKALKMNVEKGHSPQESNGFQEFLASLNEETDDDLNN